MSLRVTSRPRWANSSPAAVSSRCRLISASLRSGLSVALFTASTLAEADTAYPLLCYARATSGYEVSDFGGKDVYRMTFFSHARPDRRWLVLVVLDGQSSY